MVAQVFVQKKEGPNGESLDTKEACEALEYYKDGSNPNNCPSGYNWNWGDSDCNSNYGWTGSGFGYQDLTTPNYCCKSSEYRWTSMNAEIESTYDAHNFIL